MASTTEPGPHVEEMSRWEILAENAHAWLDIDDIGGAETLAQSFLEQGAAAPSKIENERWAKVLLELAEKRWAQGPAQRAASVQHYDSAVKLYQRNGDADREGMVLCGLGFALLKSGGMLDKALVCLERARDLANKPAVASMLAPLIDQAKAQLAEGLQSARMPATSGCGSGADAGECCSHPGGCGAPSIPHTATAETAAPVTAAAAATAATATGGSASAAEPSAAAGSDAAKRRNAAAIKLETHIHTHALAVLELTAAARTSELASLVDRAGGVRADASDAVAAAYVRETHAGAVAEPHGDCALFLCGKPLAVSDLQAMEAASAEGGVEGLAERVQRAGESHRAAIQQQIDALVRDAQRDGTGLLFMKGAAGGARCKFSRKAVDLLREAHVPFRTFNVLESWDVRVGLKAYSSWATLPQFFFDGVFVGGVDVLEEMASGGMLSRWAAQLGPEPGARAIE